MENYNFIAKGLITTINNNKPLEFSILCTYGSETNAIEQVVKRQYIKTEEDLFIPYHAITSVKIIEIHRLGEW